MSFTRSRGGRSQSFRAPNRRRFVPNMRNAQRINRSHYVQQAVEPVLAAAYQSQHTFADFGLDQRIYDNVIAHGYTTPTPIQDQAIPAMMQERDVVGIANTGTGKTAAFLLPFIHTVLHDSSQGVLIMAPTRELALQIYDEFQAFARSLPISVASCIGGASLGAQVERLKTNPHFVIGTPGRIKDLIQRHALKTEKFTNIVLDEVDRMLDIGFRQDIEFIIAKLATPRRSAFFSATMNTQTQQVMRQLMTNPVTVTIPQNHNVRSIEQNIVELKPGQNKMEVLHSLLVQSQFERVIVFGRTKHGINKLERQLFERGVQVRAIHGNKNQNARQRALSEFKRGQVKALLATDIAARGIDVDDVTHVINYDEPESYDTYLHRIGRTGRAGKKGVALTFVC